VNVLEHVEDDNAFVAELHGVAKDLVFVTTPNWTRRYSSIITRLLNELMPEGRRIRGHNAAFVKTGKRSGEL